MRVWAASGAAQLRAEVQLDSEGAGWRRSPWGFSKVIQPIASWEQPRAEHVCLPRSSPCPGTDHMAGARGAEELGWKTLLGETRSEPARPPPPPLSPSWPVVLDLSDLLRRSGISQDSEIFCLPCHSLFLFLLFTAHLWRSCVGSFLSPPFVILGTSHSSMYLSESSRCDSCLSMAESLSSPLCGCARMAGNPASRGATSASCDAVCRDAECRAKLCHPFSFCAPGERGIMASPGLVKLCFSQLNSLPSPHPVFLHYPCLCHVPHLLQPNSAAGGDDLTDACPRFTAAACLPHGSFFYLPATVLG
ncbi:uncharacterized protein LOC128854179 [Cuculus canorus]|uniref:uncharacterized protein LOC128854179 n=1 Tax=Cuculus canorus TaxID=55661 RepID=UPI0023AAD0B7|nr:uncharacterized protein LOC128854179 [Cuculus canorus]